MGLAQQIFDVEDTEAKTIDVPEWGVKLELRSPNGAERAELIKAFVSIDDLASGSVKMSDLSQMYPAAIIACAHDPETGERVFESSPDTIAALNRKKGDVLERIAQDCLVLCGLTPDAVDATKDGSSISPGSASPSL